MNCDNKNSHIKTICDNDENMNEAKAIVDEFSENFLLFNEDIWKIVEKEIDNDKKLRINVSEYYIEDFELEDELMNTDEIPILYPKNIKYPEIYYIKNGEKCL